MSKVNEKYASEALLSEEARRKLGLVIKNGSVTTDKLKDGAVITSKVDNKAITASKIADKNVTWDKLDENTKNIITSQGEGGIHLATELGNSTGIGITQKKITEELNAANSKIDNIADEEDLTMVSVDGRPAIQLRDKAYEREKHSGLGRKYLRKNVTYDVEIVHFGGFVENVAVQAIGAVITDGNSSNVVYDRIRKAFLYREQKGSLTPAKYYNVWTSEEVPYSDYYQSSYSEGYTIRTDVVFMLGDVPYRWDENDQELAVWGDFYEAHSKNILTQAMINEPNTIYHIQYDYDLNGQTITVPEGCTLEFEGGKIYDSVGIANISCNNTRFKGNVLLEGVIIAGSILNEYIDVTWFGLTSSGDNASRNDGILEHYMLPSCANTGRRMNISHNIAISKPMSVMSFDLWCEGNILYYGPDNLDGAVLTVSGSHRNFKIKIANSARIESFDVRKEYGIIGVDCNHVTNSVINIEYVWDFTIGVRVSSSSGGNGYNTYNMGYICNSYKNLVIFRTNGTWVNENIFNGGRFCSTSTSVWYKKNVAISFIQEGVVINSPTDHIFNNLIFHKPCAEGAAVCIYSNSTVQDSSIDSLRNEGAAKLIEESENTPSSGYTYSCVVTTYRYIKTLNRNYKTFTYKVKTYSTTSEYNYDLSGLLYYNSKAALCISFRNIIVGGYTFIGSDDTKFLISRVDALRTHITENYLDTQSLLGYGYLFSKAVGKNSLKFTITIGNGIFTEAGESEGEQGESVDDIKKSRVCCVFMKEDYTILSIEELANVSSIGAAIKSINSNKQARYYSASVAENYYNVIINNIPPIVKYVYIGIKGDFIIIDGNRVLASRLSGATLFIDSEYTPIMQPSGQLYIPNGEAIGSYQIPLNSPICYLGANRLMYEVHEDSNGNIVNNIIDKDYNGYSFSVFDTDVFGNAVFSSDGKAIAYNMFVLNISKLQEVASYHLNLRKGCVVDTSAAKKIKIELGTATRIHVAYLDSEGNNITTSESEKPLYSAGIRSMAFNSGSSTFYNNNGDVKSLDIDIPQSVDRIFLGIPIQVYPKYFRVYHDEVSVNKMLTKGITEERPVALPWYVSYKDTTLKKEVWWNGTTWVEEDGAVAGVLRSGTFADKPVAADIYVGFKYFCTDKQTTEGQTNGIEIIHKGNDVWVDALGRVVS